MNGFAAVIVLALCLAAMWQGEVRRRLGLAAGLTVAACALAALASL